MDTFRKAGLPKRLVEELARYEPLTEVSTCGGDHGGCTVPVYRERGKELACLYRISTVIEVYGEDKDRLLEYVAAVVPPGWQYPEITSCGAVLDGVVYGSLPDVPEEWTQTAAIACKGAVAGRVVVSYRKAMPRLEEGPFLLAERLLIESIAKRVGAALDRVDTQERLRNKRASLESANNALMTLLDSVEKRSQKTKDDLLKSIRAVVSPQIEELRLRLPVEYRQRVDALARSIDGVVSPLVGKLTAAEHRLSPAELQVAVLIGQGLSTKEIARLKDKSPATVSRQRDSIRRKLGLQNSGVNLQTYIAGLELA